MYFIQSYCILFTDPPPCILSILGAGHGELAVLREAQALAREEGREARELREHLHGTGRALAADVDALAEGRRVLGLGCSIRAGVRA